MGAPRAEVLRSGSDCGLSVPRASASRTRLHPDSVSEGDRLMKVMVIVKASADSEAGVMPSQQMLTDMGNFNEELVKAGIMLAGEGLHPSSKGKRVLFSGRNRSVTDGPFA